MKENEEMDMAKFRLVVRWSREITEQLKFRHWKSATIRLMGTVLIRSGIFIHLFIYLLWEELV